MGRRSEVRRIIGSLQWQGLEALEQRCLATAAPGAEFLVNTWTMDTQATSPAAAIASDDAGDFVAVWESYNRDAAGTYGIYGQRFMADGMAVGAEFAVNTTVLSDQRTPAVSMNGSGAFVVAWEGMRTLRPTFPGIYVQRYDAQGAALGSEIEVAATLELVVNEPAVAISASGAFIVAWEENGPDGRDIAARIYDASGSATGPAFRVNQTTAGNQRQPQLVVDGAGNFAVTWNGNGSGDDAGVFSRLFGPTGTPLTGEVLLNTTATGAQSFSAIARDGDGGFMVVWSGNGVGDTAGVFARRMSSAGVPVGSEFRVNETILATQQRPSVAFDPDGDFVVSWSGYGEPDTSGIYAREFWRNDTPKAGEVFLNTTVPGIQINASVASTGDNRHAVVWHGPGAGDATGVFGRLLVNIAPTISATGGTVEYVEDGSPVAVDWGVTVNDPDSMIASATVRIEQNYVASEDLLVFSDQLGITGSWDVSTGVLTLTGRAPAWDYEAALQSVAYANSSQNPSAAARMVAFAVHDGSVGTAAVTGWVTVAPVNDAPVMTMSGVDAAFVEDRGSVAVDPALVVGDIDSAMLTGATVQITGNFAPTEDALVFADQLGISGSWNPVTGLLVLTGMAGVADYQAALRSVRFVNSSQDPVMLLRTVTFLVSDGIGLSEVATAGVRVRNVNEAPVVSASGGGSAYTEDGAPVVLDAGLGVTDVDSGLIVSATLSITGNYMPGEDALVFDDQAGITGSWDAAAGVLTLSGAGTAAQYEAALRSVRYMNLSQNPSGLMRTVTVSVSDGLDASAPVARPVSVAPMNDAPGAAASAGRARYTEGGAAVVVDGGVVLSDVDSGVLSSAVVRIAGNFAAGQDSLIFSTQAGITGVWDASSATLTLSGAASVAAYQAALRSVRYVNSSSDPSTAERTVTMMVADGSGAVSVAVSRGVEVVAVPPVQPPQPPAPPSCPVRPPCVVLPPHVKLPCVPGKGVVKIVIKVLKESHRDAKHGQSHSGCESRHGDDDRHGRSHDHHDERHGHSHDERSRHEEKGRHGTDNRDSGRKK